MKLLPLTQSSLIPQALLMAPSCPNFSVTEILWSVISMASRLPSNSSTHWLITSGIGEPCTRLSVMDGGFYEISKKVTELLRSLLISDYQCKPYHQHQNKAENQWGTDKQWVNKIMNSSSCPPLCLASLPLICLCPPQPHVLSCPGGSSPPPPSPDQSDSRHQFSALFFLLGTCLLQSQP